MYVERLLKQVWLKAGQPWCAAAVYDWGYDALGNQWPLPRTGGCQVLADHAILKGVLKTAWERGDVFLIWHADLGRFAHAGVVIGPQDTVSGNTTVPGGGGNPREGWAVVRKPWNFKPEDRFIRWTDLLKEP